MKRRTTWSRDSRIRLPAASTKKSAIFSQRSIGRQSLGTRRRISSTTMRGRTRCTRLPIVTTSQDPLRSTFRTQSLSRPHAIAIA